MTSIVVVVGVEMVDAVDEQGAPKLDDAGQPVKVPDEVWDTYDGEHVTWATEPSGVLNVFRQPNILCATYAPGSWKAVRDATSQD